MVRKQTWILLGVFVVLLGAAFYLNKNPLPVITGQSPTLTPKPLLLQSWQAADVQAIEVVQGQAEPARITRDVEDGWNLVSSTGQVSAGAVEIVLSELTSMEVQGMLPSGYDLSVVGLASPTMVLTIQGAADQQAKIAIGALTPTGSGYYVQVDEQSPVVVSKYSIENVMDQLRTINTPTVDTTASTPTAVP